MKLKIYLVLVMLIFVVSTVEARSSSWSITERYSITDFDKEGNNIYLGEDGYFYVDKIDLSNKELIIQKFNKEKRKVDVIRTGITYKETEKNQYFRRNERVGLCFTKEYLYLYYLGQYYVDESFNELWKIDLKTKKKTKIANLKGIKGAVFGYVKEWKFYEDGIWVEGDYSFQMRLIVRKGMILLDSYSSSEGPEGGDFAHVYYVFNTAGTLLEWDYEDRYLPEEYPITIKENGEIIKGILAENEMEKFAKDLGYTIKEGWTMYRGFSNTDLYMVGDNVAWLSKELWKPGADDYYDEDFVSSIYKLVKENGKWKVTEFISYKNLPELEYNVFIDRILKAEGNKLWLWMRIGHNITESYEKRHFDREIWIIEKQ